MKGELFREAVELACGALGWSDVAVESLAVLDVRSETRLRFNAPTPAEACALRAAVRCQAGLYELEIEAIYWLADGAWEIWDVQVAEGGARRD